jgi:hypothetical protein
MKEHPVTLSNICTVEEIKRALGFGYRRFPVLN